MVVGADSPPVTEMRSERRTFGLRRCLSPGHIARSVGIERFALWIRCRVLRPNLQRVRLYAGKRRAQNAGFRLLHSLVVGVEDLLQIWR